jgi:hypothetical protein
MKEEHSLFHWKHREVAQVVLLPKRQSSTMQAPLQMLSGTKHCPVSGMLPE